MADIHNSTFIIILETIDWNNPDDWFAALLIQGIDQVYGKVKNGFGLLEGVPKPDTGLCFEDIVILTGPIGIQKFKDDDIKEYSVASLYAKSKFKTFAFKAQLPDYSSFFSLGDTFQQNKLSVRVSWIDNNSSLEWKDCLCAAQTLTDAESLLKGFLKRHNKASIKDLLECKIPS